ncbi:MAG: undecaprenyl-diphosphatase UppP [Chloroflexota bacterium]|nr:undecaprenyl-diphosphatase UppP [Chloroflexota bacterium]
MSLLEAVVLGVVQGLTEFLPISSSAHLILVPWLLGWDEPGLQFDAALHLGTLIAVFAYFWHDLFGMALALPRALTRVHLLLRDPESGSATDHQARLALLIAVGTIPGLLAGLAGQGVIEDFFHNEAHRTQTIVLIAILLAALALLLWLAERTAGHKRDIYHLTWRDALTIGLAQATALLPGVSRSGSTLTAGLFQGLRRADAARFSFLLGTPLVLAAASKAVLDAVQAGMSGSEARAFMVGGLTSALVGFAAIWGLLRFLQRASTLVFIVYRLLLAAGLLALVVSGFR